jgi:hypothetical protein
VSRPWRRTKDVHSQAPPATTTNRDAKADGLVEDNEAQPVVEICL